MASRKERVMSELLILRNRRGDEAALGQLVSLWQRPLFYYVRRFVDSEDDAWDALQQVWLKVIRRIGRLREPRAFPSWLYRIAHNTVVSQLRKTSSFERLSEDADVLDPKSDTGFTSGYAFDARDIHWGLGKLTPDHREILTLHFLESFSVSETAEITGAPEGTVKSRLHYAKAALRDVLEREAKHYE